MSAGSSSSAAGRPSARRRGTAVREDQGLGLALYPEQAIGPGSYPVFDPGIDTLTPRPGAAGALRWFTEQRLEAFQSDSGTVELTAAGEGFDARFGLRLVSLDRPETLRVTGTATGLVAGPCPVDSIPPTAPRTDSAAALDSATARTAVTSSRAATGHQADWAPAASFPAARLVSVAVQLASRRAPDGASDWQAVQAIRSARDAAGREAGRMAGNLGGTGRPAEGERRRCHDRPPRPPGVKPDGRRGRCGRD